MKVTELIGIVLLLILTNLFVFWIVENLNPVINSIEIMWFTGILTGLIIGVVVKEIQEEKKTN